MQGRAYAEQGGNSVTTNSKDEAILPRLLYVNSFYLQVEPKSAKNHFLLDCYRNKYLHSF